MSEKEDMIEADLSPAAHELATAMGMACRRKDLEIELFEDVEQEHWAIRFCPNDFVKIWKMIKAMMVLGHDERVAHVLFASMIKAMPDDFDFDQDLFS